jgi:hypothetical protein
MQYSICLNKNSFKQRTSDYGNNIDNKKVMMLILLETISEMSRSRDIFTWTFENEWIIYKSFRQKQQHCRSIVLDIPLKLHLKDIQFLLCDSMCYYNDAFFLTKVFMSLWQIKNKMLVK